MVAVPLEEEEEQPELGLLQGRQHKTGLLWGEQPELELPHREQPVVKQFKVELLQGEQHVINHNKK